jgi:hypothetical protein
MAPSLRVNVCAGEKAEKRAKNETPKRTLRLPLKLFILKTPQ